MRLIAYDKILFYLTILGIDLDYSILKLNLEDQ